MTRMILLFFTAVASAAAQQSGAAGGADAANGKILFTRIGCFQCHGYAGQGGRAGARIVPAPQKEQERIRNIRRPPGGMRAYTEKVASDRELKDSNAYI